MSDVQWLSNTLTRAEKESEDSSLANSIDSELAFFNNISRRRFWREQIRDYKAIVNRHRAFEAIQLYGK